MRKWKYPCGCEFEIVGEAPEGQRPPLKVDIDNLPDCPEVWKLYHEGNVKCSFQTESSLGRQFCKKVRPNSYEDLSDIVAVVRPVTLKAFDDRGVNMADNYCLRRHGEREPDKIYEPIKDILGKTQQILVYQEQVIKIVQKIAGFNASQADELRRNLSKKDGKAIAEMKQKFLDGCVQVGMVNDVEANEIWYFINKGNRYLFCEAHACKYSHQSYKTMYMKAHFPLETFRSWLVGADNDQDPQQEVKELVNDAKQWDIVITPPNILKLHHNFTLDGDEIRFGLINVKGVGESVYTKIVQSLELGAREMGVEIEELGWEDFLFRCSDHIPSTAVENLIMVGAMPFGKTRESLLYEYRTYSKLSALEKRWIAVNYGNGDNLATILEKCARPKKEGGGCHDKRGVEKARELLRLLIDPPTSLADNIDIMIANERKLLGINLTVPTPTTIQTNTTCRELLAGKKHDGMYLNIEVVDFREHKIKNGPSLGEKMCFMTIQDETGSCDSVVMFSEAYSKYENMVFEGNRLLVELNPSYKKDGYIVNQVWQS